MTKNVLPYSIVVGNPAKIIKRRFDEEIITALIDIAWWHWEPEKVSKNIQFIIGGDISALKSFI